MDELRREELTRLWNHEVTEEDEEWREDLSPEELDFVATLDDHYDQGVVRICSAIVIQDKLHKIYRPTEIAEMQTMGDHVRLRLRCGVLYNVHLDQAGELVYQAVDEVC